MQDNGLPPGLNERERLVLQAIIEDYISSGEPVGSRTITKRADVTFSAATIRNVMSDLEEMGLLNQPHTSAGRIPTDRAFRFYVDTLVKMRKPTSREQDAIEGPIKQGGMLHTVLEDATRQLSTISHLTGVMLAPRKDNSRLHHLEFVRLPDQRILVIVVDQAGMVHNKILEPDGEVSQVQLDQMTRVLNERCTGLTVKEARSRIVDEMRQARAEMNAMMSRALAMADRVLMDAERGPKDVIVAGESRVLDNPEFAQVDRIKGLLKAFEERHVLVNLLDRIEAADEVQVFIGQENRFREMANLSVVAASYGVGEEPLGVIGVIGPVRMDYARVVPLVECTAQMVTRFLEGKGNS